MLKFDKKKNQLPLKELSNSDSLKTDGNNFFFLCNFPHYTVSVFVLEDDSHTSFLVAGKPFFIGPICLQSELHIVNVE